MLTPLSVVLPATTIVAGGLSFTMLFIRDSMSTMRWLSTKCDDIPQSEVMVNFQRTRSIRACKERVVDAR